MLHSNHCVSRVLLEATIVKLALQERLALSAVTHPAPCTNALQYDVGLTRINGGLTRGSSRQIPAARHALRCQECLLQLCTLCVLYSAEGTDLAVSQLITVPRPRSALITATALDLSQASK